MSDEDGVRVPRGVAQIARWLLSQGHDPKTVIETAYDRYLEGWKALTVGNCKPEPKKQPSYETAADYLEFLYARQRHRIGQYDQEFEVYCKSLGIDESERARLYMTKVDGLKAGYPNWWDFLKKREAVESINKTIIIFLEKMQKRTPENGWYWHKNKKRFWRV